MGKRKMADTFNSYRSLLAWSWSTRNQSAFFFFCRWNQWAHNGNYPLTCHRDKNIDSQMSNTNMICAHMTVWYTPDCIDSTSRMWWINTWAVLGTADKHMTIFKPHIHNCFCSWIPSKLQGLCKLLEIATQACCEEKQDKVWGDKKDGRQLQQ